MHIGRFFAAMAATLAAVCACGPSWQESQADGYRLITQKKGATLFGSGWVWLSADQNGKLVITQEPNAANPVQKGLKPLLTFDVWEHAYYLDYQNRRPDHLAALWQIIDWDAISARYNR